MNLEVEYGPYMRELKDAQRFRRADRDRKAA